MESPELKKAKKETLGRRYPVLLKVAEIIFIVCYVVVLLMGIILIITGGGDLLYYSLVAVMTFYGIWYFLRKHRTRKRN